MRMLEEQISRCDLIGYVQGGRPCASAAQLYMLTSIAWIVMYRLGYRTIRSDEPFRGASGVLHPQFPPFGIARLPVCPPKDLEIHHGINDGIVTVDFPGGNQVRTGIEQLRDPLCGPQPALFQLGGAGLLVAKNTGGILKETRIVAPLRLAPPNLRLVNF